METKKNLIYNLIILDESGSMSCVTNQTISGCNETLNTIRSAQKQYADTQEHFVSIYAFQSGGRPSRYLFKNVPVDEVNNITDKDYEPWGCTPLNDAVGMTLADLKATTKSKENAIGSVTIITDGYENASREWTGQGVKALIEECRKLGWMVSFVGAMEDAKEVATSISIKNVIHWEQTHEGTQAMSRRERDSRHSFFMRLSTLNCMFDEEPDMSVEERRKLRKEISDDYYMDNDNDNVNDNENENDNLQSR